MEESIRNAEQKDIKRLESFLAEANLDTDGLADCIDYYSLLETKSGKLKACIGIEPEGDVGLLRSFVVSQTTTQVQIMLLFDRVIRIAQNKKLRSLYLVTKTESAVAFFKKIGFNWIEGIPSKLEKNRHFKQVIGVDNSILMEMTLADVDNSNLR